MSISSFNNEERKKICEKLIEEIIPLDIPNRFREKKFDILSCLSVFNSKNIEIDIEEIYEEILTDGPGDTGIDGIAIIINGTCITSIEQLEEFKKNVNQNWNINLHIFQARFNNKWPTQILNTFNTLLPDFLTCQDNLIFKSDIKNKQNIWKLILENKPNNSKTSLNINICNVGEPQEIFNDQQWKNSKKQLETTLKSIAVFEKSVYINLIGLEFLKINYNKKIFEKKLSFISQIYDSFSDNENIDGHLLLVNLNEYYNFIINENKEIIDSIFSQNVRDYQKNTEINKNILKSLEEETKEIDFWWLNNGITILADSCSSNYFSLKIKNPQIINGLQTSYSIYKYFSKKINSHETEKRKILIKIVLTNNQNNATKIIEASNTQNSMNWASLRANENTLVSLESDFKPYNIFLERRKKFYSNQGKKSSDILAPDYIAKYYVSAYNKKPAEAKNRTIIYFREKENFDNIFNEKNKKKLINISLLSRDIIRKNVNLTFNNDHFSLDEIDYIKIHFKYHLISIYFEYINKDETQQIAEKNKLFISFEKLLELIYNFKIKESHDNKNLKSISTDKDFQNYMYENLKN